MAKRCIPGLSAWNRFGTQVAGGPAASYEADAGGVRYTIAKARHGYQLTSWGSGPGHQWIGPDGEARNFPFTSFRSPQAAAKAADAHCRLFRGR